MNIRDIKNGIVNRAMYRIENESFDDDAYLYTSNPKLVEIIEDIVLEAFSKAQQLFYNL